MKTELLIAYRVPTRPVSLIPNLCKESLMPLPKNTRHNIDFDGHTVRVIDPRNGKVLRFILSQQPTFPTKKQIADHMGWKNSNSATDVLNILSVSGCLSRTITSTKGQRHFVFTVTEHAVTAIQDFEAKQKVAA